MYLQSFSDGEAVKQTPRKGKRERDRVVYSEKCWKSCACVCLIIKS